MDNKERMERIKEKFGKLQEDDKITKGTTKTRNFKDNSYLNNAIEIVKSHLNDNGRTEIPISFKEYADDLGFKTSGEFNHIRDKTLRLFEIATVCVLELEDMKDFTGLYKKENTELIRKHLIRNKHLHLVSNSEDRTDLYLSLDVSDLISKEE